MALARLVLGPEADVDEVVQASLAGERIFHGEPSGLDSEVAARGGLLRYVRGERPRAVTRPGPLPLLVVPSWVVRSTAAQVAKVRARVEAFPTVARPMLEALGQAVDYGIEALADRDHAALGELMQIAHGVLAAFGVSSPILDAMCSTALLHGALGAKLTGAGGGGCIVVLPGQELGSLVTAFEADGYAPLAIEL